MIATISNDIFEAKRILESGQLVAIPTETVYGLAANALDVQAVSKIFEAKNRPTFDPLIVHIGSVNQLEKYTQEIPDVLFRIFDKFSPGPITVLLKKKHIIPDLVTSGLEKVAIRIPDHPVTKELLQSLDFPLAAPSANPFGYVSPTTSAHVFEQMGARIPFILEGGPCQVGLESTIIGYENGETVVYRKGGLAIEEIENFISKKLIIQEHSSSNPKAPGMLEQHYSPGKKIVLIDNFENNNLITRNTAYLGFESLHPIIEVENQFILSEKADLNEAAQRLFSGLRFLDNSKFDFAIVSLAPEYGLGRAINDRLRRAAAF